MSYTPPTFAALTAELRDAAEVAVVARHLIDTRAEEDLVALLSDGLRLHRQAADLALSLGSALHTVLTAAAPAANAVEPPAAPERARTPLLHRRAG